MLRMYYIEGCQYCQQAKQFFAERGVSCEYVNPNGDPISNSGLAQVFPGRPYEYPVLVNKMAENITVGFRKEVYERLAQLLGTRPGPSLLDGGADALQPVREIEAVVEVETPQTPRTNGVSDVSGLVGEPDTHVSAE